MAPPPPVAARSATALTGPRTAAGALLVLVVVLAALAACGRDDEVGRPATEATRPNIVLLVTDDQRLDGMAHMPATSRIFTEQGTTFDDSVVSFPLCCPNRATLLTGQHAHNHGVLDNLPPYGAASLDSESALPAALQEAGYHTSHLGKWLNGYGETMPAEPLPGWDEWWTFIDPSTYEPYDFRISTNDGIVEPDQRERLHTTDATWQEAVRQVQELSAGDQPYYLQVDFVAPHSMTGGGAIALGAPIPQPRFADVPVQVATDDAAFAEEDITDKPAWLESIAIPGRALVQGVSDPLATATARSLLGVDEGVEAIAEAIDETGEDTLLVFTSDHGLMMGEHGLVGKVVPYEPAIRVPLMARGAGFPEGVVVDAPVASVDVAATVAALAGAEPPRELDGRSLLALAEDPPDGDADPRAILIANGPGTEVLPHYDGVRVDGWVYLEWETGELELYDLEADPSQLESLHTAITHTEVREQLAALLDQLRDCVGEQCDVFASIPRP